MTSEPWVEVTSGRLLRRLADKGLIEEPPTEERPTTPSKRQWGRGYNYVNRVDGQPVEWDFEGSRYQLTKKNGKLYVWKQTETRHRKRRS